MSTKLIEIKALDFYENPKLICATSFSGGIKRGMMLSITIEHLEGLKSQIGIELNKAQAINLAKMILEKFDSESTNENS